MKAYIVNITFQQTVPGIWRRIIIPAGATFKRMHDIIQHVTNFQDSHSYAFEVDGLFITNNDAILEEYKGKIYAGLKVKSPIRLKIDEYLEQKGELEYEYDFGDSWKINIKLEETVEDYYFGYPTVLEAGGIAPPEDVGGVPGYVEFLKVYHDPKHPAYLHQYSWAKSQLYYPFDIDEANEQFKQMKYQKTQWGQIDHDNYFILSDKYRKPDYLDLYSIKDEVDEVINYVIACVHLYGFIETKDFLEIHNSYHENQITSKTLRSIFSHPANLKRLENLNIEAYADAFVHGDIELISEFDRFIQGVMGKPFYVPENVELLRYLNNGYYEKTEAQQELGDKLEKDFLSGNKLAVIHEVDKLVGQLRIVDINFNEVVQEFLQRYEFEDINQANQYIELITKIANTTRVWENRGHTPHELFQMERHYLQPLPKETSYVQTDEIIGRNDPCICGIGKKYKKCCGK